MSPWGRPGGAGGRICYDSRFMQERATATLTAMIVDDEHLLVVLAEEILAELGYEPVGFESSTAALQALRANPQRFDLVLTDEAMPELVGTAIQCPLILAR